MESIAHFHPLAILAPEKEFYLFPE